MGDSSSVDVILDFLRRNKFARAEAALRSELSNRSDLNGFIEKLSIEENDTGKLLEEENGRKGMTGNQGTSTTEVSKELIVKEIECGTGRNGSESKWKNPACAGERNKSNEPIGVSVKNFAFSKSSEDAVRDLYSWNFNPSLDPVDPIQIDGSINTCTLSGFQVTGQSGFHSAEVSDVGKANAKPKEDISFPSEMRMSWLGSTSKSSVEPKFERNQASKLKELDQHHKVSGAPSRDNFVDNPWSRSNEPTRSTSESWKDCSVETVFPFSKLDASTSYENVVIGDQKEGMRRADISGRKAAIKEQVDAVGRTLYFGKTQESSEKKNISSLGFPLAPENQKEELPRLPPVKLKSEDKALGINWDEKFDCDGPGSKLIAADNTFLIGSYLDVPIGQEISSSGGKRTGGGGSWLSVSQGIAEDSSDLVAGFATIGDGLSESVDYPNEYWDSDEYDDDDDVGYMRQPIEDETWFLAHEIDYPSDNEKGTGHGSVPDTQERVQPKDEDDDQSFAEEDSYFSGERYFQSKNVNTVIASDDPIGLSVTEMYGRTDDHDLIAQYDGQLMDEEELNLMRAEPVWQGFVTQTNELIMLGEGKVLNDCERPRLDDICMEDDQHESVRSIGVGINSDAADIGSEVRESLVGGSSEGDLEYFHDHDIDIRGSRHSNKDKKRTNKHRCDKYVMGSDKGVGKQVKSHTDPGFSFPPPRDGQLVQTSKSLRSNKSNAVISDETDDCLNTHIGAVDDMLSSWRRKSSDSSPVKSSRDENIANVVGSENSSPSTLSDHGYAEKMHVKKEEDDEVICTREEDLGASLEDEEAVAVQEQVKQIKAQEEEFETFNLKIVHRKNRTGFEEDKNFHVVLNSVIAGRYHVTEYLGSAAFSKAIQAHDLHTGMDVCVKIIKNNKDFFDQSLDEIKLLKFVNRHDPADKYHILRLYDYFYYRVGGFYWYCFSPILELVLGRSGYYFHHKPLLPSTISFRKKKKGKT
ncbi:hypothetical protein U1Q18_037779 [Sarracenia purpurea var. burkii]